MHPEPCDPEASTKRPDSRKNEKLPGRVGTRGHQFGVELTESAGGCAAVPGKPACYWDLQAGSPERQSAILRSMKFSSASRLLSLIIREDRTVSIRTKPFAVHAECEVDSPR